MAKALNGAVRANSEFRGGYTRSKKSSSDTRASRNKNSRTGAGPKRQMAVLALPRVSASEITCFDQRIRLTSTEDDFFRNNCNNFSEHAARNGLGLRRGVPSYILEMPGKVLSSPMGQLLRPMFDNIQVGHAPTNINSSTTSSPAVSAPPTRASPAAPPNPWASIPPKQTAVEHKGTPLLDKQQMLLSTDTSIVAACIGKLHPDDEQYELLRKLSTSDPWSSKEISSVLCYLRSVIETDEKKKSCALMLFRLVVLKESKDEVNPDSGEEYETSTDFVRSLLLSDMLSLANLSMAYCVLSNAIGTKAPKWVGSDKDRFQQLVDRAMVDCDISKEGPSTQAQVSLRQMAAALIYNSSRLVGNKNANKHDDDLSEVEMSILVGCLERLQTETDEVTSDRLYMSLGELYKSKSLGQAAISLTKDLGMHEMFVDRPIAKEVASFM